MRNIGGKIDLKLAGKPENARFMFGSISVASEN